MTRNDDIRSVSNSKLPNTPQLWAASSIWFASNGRNFLQRRIVVWWDKTTRAFSLFNSRKKLYSSPKRYERLAVVGCSVFFWRCEPLQRSWDQWNTLKVFCKVSRCRMCRVEGWLLLQAGLSLGGYCGYCLLLSGVFVINTVIHLTMLTWRGSAPHCKWMLESVSVGRVLYFLFRRRV